MPGFKNHPLEPTMRTERCLALLQALQTVASNTTSWDSRDSFSPVKKRVRDVREVLEAYASLDRQVPLFRDKLPIHADLSAALAQFETLAGSSIMLFYFGMEAYELESVMPAIIALVEAQAAIRLSIAHLPSAPGVSPTSPEEAFNPGLADTNELLGSMSDSDFQLRFRTGKETVRELNRHFAEMALHRAVTAYILRTTAATSAILIRASALISGLAGPTRQPERHKAKATLRDADEQWRRIELVLQSSSVLLPTTTIFADTFERLGAPDIARQFRALI